MVYLPPAFAENDPEGLVSHIEDHEFGVLVSSGSRRVSGRSAGRFASLVEA